MADPVEPKKAPAASPPDESWSTGPSERGQFECHEEDGEVCDGRAAPTPDVDAEHPEIKKVPAVTDAPRAKDERALFECDKDGENCDS